MNGHPNSGVDNLPSAAADSPHAPRLEENKREGYPGDAPPNLRDFLARAFMARRGSDDLAAALDDADVAVRAFREFYPDPDVTPEVFWFLKQSWEKELRRTLGVQVLLFAAEMERSGEKSLSDAVHEIGVFILKSEI